MWCLISPGRLVQTLPSIVAAPGQRQTINAENVLFGDFMFFRGPEQDVDTKAENDKRTKCLEETKKQGMDHAWSHSSAMLGAFRISFSLDPRPDGTSDGWALLNSQLDKR